ncbi:TIAM1 protein, partial [Polypterus senegalus]
MGNLESQNGDHSFYGDSQVHLSRKQMTRSLRISSKSSRRSRHASSGKVEHRHSETSTRSSSTPSIPQSLADNGLEPYNENCTLEGFSSPLWGDQVAMSMRPVSFHDDPLADSNLDFGTVTAATSVSSMQDSKMYHCGTLYLQKTKDGPQGNENIKFKKKRSKSADMWREDSLEFSLSDLSQEHLTSTEDIIDTTDEKDFEDAELFQDDGTTKAKGSMHRANSLNELSGQSNSSTMVNETARFDITTEEGSEYTDSVIHGAIPDAYHLSRCSEAMSATYSSDALTEGSICAKSEASSNSEDAVQGVYENFRRELQMSSVNTENLEEAGSAGSDEQTSGTLSSPGQSDILSAAQGTVRKAGALSVKNFLVHKKNKKVELAPRRKWKHYWVSLKGCTLFFYEIDDRSGIDQSSIPKHAVWVENSIVQAVPEHPKKDFVFCLSNVLGDAYLFQTCNQTELENWITAVHSACATEVARQHHKEDTVKMLKAEIKKLEQKIDMDEKMKKMGEMQLSAVSDSKKRKTILEQVAARTESGVRRRSQVISRSASRRRSRFSSLWGLDTTSKKKLKGRPSINQVFTNSEEPMKKSLEAMFDDVGNCESTEHVAAFCQSLHDMNLSELSSQSLDSLAHQPVTQRQLTDTDKMRKVICELVETERTYVKDLHCLIEKYLTPLQKEMFLTQDELDVLFGNVQEMVEFQDEFLKTLEDGTRLVPDLEKLENIDQFKKVLFSLGGSFLYYADRFKIYSAFCASHTKVPKVLVKARTDPDFKAFLDAQNPKQQHSATLESYLIKPIQRILKYPLLLKELYSLTDPESEEHYHLDVAMKAMNKVASHINEMQKIHEEYGAVFDQLIAEQTGEKKEGTSHKASFSEERDPFRFRHMISTEALQIRTHASGDTEGGSECDVVHVKSESEGRPERIFHLCCSSPESKKEFLKTIQCIIRDKQRRQLLKTESLPLNQQYIPFGGKRLCALKGARPVMNRAVSAPTRTLGKRKITRNRYTIDVDIAFGSSTTEVSPEQPPKQQTVLGGDTDQWVEEQFDLDRYEDQDEVKETDILSDDEEHGCCSKAFSVDLQDLANIDSTEEDTLKTKASNLQALKMSHLKKQSAVTELLSETESSAEEVIWVKREDFVPTPNSNV